MISEQEIRAHLKCISYPGSRRDIVSLGLVGEILTKEDTVIVHLRPSSATEEVLRHLTGTITATLSAVPGVRQVAVHSGRPRGAPAQPSPVSVPAQAPLPGVRRVIAVAKDLFPLAAVGTHVIAHILDDAEDRDIDLTEHGNTTLHV